jgi:hypothetical protein
MTTSATAVNATSAMRNSSDTTGCGPVGIAHLNEGIAHLILNFIAAPSSRAMRNLEVLQVLRRDRGQ